MTYFRRLSLKPRLHDTTCCHRLYRVQGRSQKFVLGYKFLLHNILQSYILTSSDAINAQNNFQGLILGVYIPIYAPVATALIVYRNIQPVVKPV